MSWKILFSIFYFFLPWLWLRYRNCLSSFEPTVISAILLFNEASDRSAGSNTFSPFNSASRKKQSQAVSEKPWTCVRIIRTLDVKSKQEAGLLFGNNWATSGPAVPKSSHFHWKIWRWKWDKKSEMSEIFVDGLGPKKKQWTQGTLKGKFIGGWLFLLCNAASYLSPCVHCVNVGYRVLSSHTSLSRDFVVFAVQTLPLVPWFYPLAATWFWPAAAMWPWME